MKSTRIYFVEDEALIAMDLRERLTELGYEVCGSAARGDTAVQEIAELRPDLVLMDINLGGAVDGVEVARQLHGRHDVPVVFLTAYADAELIGRALQSNVFGYLVKPYEERELHATLQVALVRHATERALREQTVVDPLTGLYNRRFLDEMLAIEISRARRASRSLCVAMIDVDHFKELNDTHGHEAGDLVLQRLASTIRKALRSSDLACRYGGDEFAVIMHGVAAPAAVGKVSLICALVREMAIPYRGARLRLTLSAGVAEIPATGGSPEALLRAADAALYRAKLQGRDRVYEADTPLMAV